MRFHALSAACALAASSCAGPQKPPCTTEQVAALRQFYEAAASQVISSGQCDKVQRIENCSAYRALELHFEVASKAMCE